MNTNKYVWIAVGGLFLLIATFFAALLGYTLFFRPTSAATPEPIVFVTATQIPDEGQASATPEPTQTAAAPTATSEPTATSQPAPTATAAPTSTPLPCNLAGFVMDVSVPDGSDFLPDESFVKTWRLRNLGSCTWNTDYALVFVGGSRMSAPQSVALKSSVAPGQTVDISVTMTAPEDNGSYQGYWQLKSPGGQLFGIGTNGSGSIWALIDVALPCSWAEFVKDISFPDNSLIPAGTVFEKTWRIKNIGACTWTKNYELVYESGDKLGASALVFALPQTVKPGEVVDLSVQLVAPEQLGHYRGYWMLRNQNGQRFGFGDDRDTAFWVDIQSIATAGAYRYDFAANFCQATWRSDEGKFNCMDEEDDSDGFVRWVANPKLENRQENEPALWLHPNEALDGWISGTYPEFEVKEGDHFRTWVGCMAGYESCDVTFRLDYRIDGGELQTLGVWNEVYDGQVTIVDFDLAYTEEQNAFEVDMSSLAGEKVQFILSVHVASHAKQAQAFWFAPRIESD